MYVEFYRIEQKVWTPQQFGEYRLRCILDVWKYYSLALIINRFLCSQANISGVANSNWPWTANVWARIFHCITVQDSPVPSVSVQRSLLLTQLLSILIQILSTSHKQHTADSRLHCVLCMYV